MVSKAKKEAKKRYQKEKVKQLVVYFYPKDVPLYEHVREHKSYGGYIKELIQADMDKGNS